MNLSWKILLGTIAIVLGACSSSDPDPTENVAPTRSSDTNPGAATTACDAPATVLATRCATSGCHAARGATLGLDLASPGLRARVEGKSAAGGSGVLVDPGGDPEKSVLYTKCTSTPPFGARMPSDATTLSADELACLASWIASGT